MFNKDSLGKPNQGFHKHLFGVAILDVLGTIIICYILAEIFHWNILLTIIIGFILGQIAHWYFQVKTVWTKNLGLIDKNS